MNQLTQRARLKRLACWIGLPLFVLVAVGATILYLKWPFSKQSVADSIREVISGDIRIQKFKSHYFPNPGCEAEGVLVLSPSGVSDPLVTVQRITIQARYADLVLRPGFVARIVLTGLQVHIPPRGSGHDGKSNSSSTSSKTRIGEIVANGSVLEVARQDDKPPLRFQIHSLTLKSVSRDTPFAYTVALTNALPPGEITSAGHLGPWTGHPLGKTPVSGSYKFSQADLGVFPGVAGMLSSDDRFEGELDEIHLQGNIKIPDFEVKSSHHPVPLITHYDATVNATNGDVFLHRVDTSLLETWIVASGQVAGEKGQKGKTTRLNVEVREGRIQDLLRLFVKSPLTPLNGTTNFLATVLVTPQGRPFLKEVDLRGDFGIESGHFTNPRTQSSVDDLSNRAHGAPENKSQAADPENVISDLRGHVHLRDGVANFADIKFNVPWALARFNGSYNLLNGKIDFRGTLKTQAELSQTTTGVKSVLLKPLNDLFKRKHAGAEVPVEITGTYHNPHFGIDLKPGLKEKQR